MRWDCYPRDGMSIPPGLADWGSIPQPDCGIEQSGPPGMAELSCRDSALTARCVQTKLYACLERPFQRTNCAVGSVPAPAPPTARLPRPLLARSPLRCALNDMEACTKTAGPQAYAVLRRIDGMAARGLRDGGSIPQPDWGLNQPGIEGLPHGFLRRLKFYPGGRVRPQVRAPVLNLAGCTRTDPAPPTSNLRPPLFCRAHR